MSFVARLAFCVNSDKPPVFTSVDEFASFRGLIEGSARFSGSRARHSKKDVIENSCAPAKKKQFGVVYYD
jgi:hypothetical protein